ncbi:MAG: class I SAM-dependent methyltransferase [Anaerolineaceae bacterium]|nr:class I SAM-dependent methyltransferase [Anaerolineaceae bacterium]
MSDRLAGSFRDPSGFVFQQNHQYFRQVNRVYQEDYDLLISSGLYQALEKKQLLIPHQEVTQEAPVPEIAYKVIQPETIDFITYPYEWSFSQLKDAALLTLAIQRQALEHGMMLKDASAYNIQFRNGAPVFIDTLSFTRYIEGMPWVAYRQFCQHFLAPLALVSKVDIRLNQMLRQHIDGIPLDLASKLLPKSTHLHFGLLSHIHLHAYAQHHYTTDGDKKQPTQATVSKISLIGLIDNLENTIRHLRVKSIATNWSDYYQATNYTDDATRSKEEIIHALLTELAPRVVWDLGANTGRYSRLALDLPGCQVISMDMDPGAVEINYLQSKKAGETNLLPLIVDLTNPSPAIGWNNEERLSWKQRKPADVVMALALVHHLAISNNVPLRDIANMMAGLGKHLIIEFVPKEDSQVQRLLAARDDIFTEYTIDGFKNAFSEDYHLRREIPVEHTTRTIFLFERKE